MSKSENGQNQPIFGIKMQCLSVKAIQFTPSSVKTKETAIVMFLESPIGVTYIIKIGTKF